jgi:hypothetical protein
MSEQEEKKPTKRTAKTKGSPFEFDLKIEEHLAYFIANKTAQRFSPTQILEEYKTIRPTINEKNIDDVLNEARLRSMVYTNRAKLGYTPENILATAQRIIDEAKKGV